MRLPKRIADILKRKQDFIDSQRSKLESSVVRFQSKLFSDIISELIPQLDTENGNILETKKNYQLLSVLDKTYKSFQKEVTPALLNQMIAGTSKIASMSQDYFSVTLSEDILTRLEKVVTATNKLLDLRLGLNEGKLVRGGFLESFFNSNEIGTELKNMTSKAITSGMKMKDFVSALREKISGVDTRTGMMERQFQRFAYDLYQQYDAAYNRTVGNELGFTYFIYQGGLVDDSRDFCAAHNNKVWSVEESKMWGEWTPADGEYPAGYEIKQKDQNAVPSYIDYPGYDPLIDRGGYNCRHSLGWIPDDMAMKMRNPDQNVKTLMTRAENSAQEVNDVSQRLADQHKGVSTPVNLKSKESILRKVTNELNGDFSQIKDAVRTTVVVPENEMAAIFKSMERDQRFIKVKMQTPDKYAGYSGILANIKTANGLTAEIQANTAKMIYAKESVKNAKSVIGEEMWNKINKATGLEGGLGHKYYEEIRVLDKFKDADKIIELTKLSEQYYSNFR